MTLSITHPFTSGKSDGSDATRVQSSNWNAAHTLTGQVPLANGGTGASTVAAARTALLLDAASSPQVADGTASSGTKTLDVSASYPHKLTNGGAFTLAFSNWASSGTLSCIEIELVNGAAFTITWPTINWFKGDGTSSTTFSNMGVTLKSSGTNFIAVWTTDGGATLNGRAI